MLDRIELGLHEHRSVLGVLPTGGGKTTIFCELARRHVARGERVLVLAHRSELVEQIASSLARIGLAHDVIAPKATCEAAAARQASELGESLVSPDSEVQVASVQSLSKATHRASEPSLVVVDEGHHATQGTAWGRCIEPWPAARCLLVTATPMRLDGRGLGVESGGYARTLVEGPKMHELIASGHLADFRAFGCKPLDLAGVRSRAGDFARGELADAMSRPKIVGNAVDHYLDLCPGEAAVVFCVSVHHCYQVADAFARRGIAACGIDGTLKPAERARRLAALASGEVKVLTSADLIGEGLDIPCIAAAILLRPTQSLGLYMQQVGRALRPAPGKTHATILDHAGNIGRHGMPDDLREWTLEGRKSKGKGKGDPGVVTCEACFAIFRRVETKGVCPACGAVLPKCPRKIAEEAGRLVELERKRKAIEAAKARQAQGQARTIEQLARLPHVKSRQHAAAIMRARERKAALVEQAIDIASRQGQSVNLAALGKMKPRELESWIADNEGAA